MKLVFQQQTIEFEETPAAEEVIAKINDMLQNDFYFSHLLVAGEEIIEDPEIYLTKNLGNIDTVEVIAVAAKEFVNELLLSGEEYAKRAVLSITTLAEEFYNAPTPNSWTELGGLFEGVQWMMTMIETVRQSTVSPSNWNSVLMHSSALQEELGNLEEALENVDLVLIADMLQYEVLPAFAEMGMELTTAIDTEGIRHDLN